MNYIRKHLSSNNKERCETIVGRILLIVVFIGGIIFFEDNVSTQNSVLSAVLTFILEVVLTFVVVPNNKKQMNDKYEGYIEYSKGMSFGMALKCMIKDFCITYKENYFFKTAILLCSTVVLSSAFASINISERVMAAVGGFINFEVVNGVLENKDEQMAVPNLSEEDQEWIDKQDDELIEVVETLKVSDEELAFKRVLSNSDKNLIFFLDGEYLIQNWDKEVEVTNTIRRFVRDRLSVLRENQFDKQIDQGGAPELIRGTVANISEMEPTITSFQEYKDNMEVRMDVYNIYPKGSIANLISNDEHLLALTLFYRGGQEESIMYHYSKAIQYRFSRIEFADISLDHVKSELEWISGRYADIAFTCPNSEMSEYAKILQKAFADIASEY